MEHSHKELKWWWDYSKNKQNTTCQWTLQWLHLTFSETGVTSVRWAKWFMKTGQIITVTGQIHGHHTTTRAVLANTQLPSLPKPHWHTVTQACMHHKHTPQALSLCCGFVVAAFQNQSNKTTPSASDCLLILFPACAYWSGKIPEITG